MSPFQGENVGSSPTTRSNVKARFMVSQVSKLKLLHQFAAFPLPRKLNKFSRCNAPMCALSSVGLERVVSAHKAGGSSPSGRAIVYTICHIEKGLTKEVFFMFDYIHGFSQTKTTKGLKCMDMLA